MNKHLWRETNVRLIPCVILLIIGATISSDSGDVRRGNFDHKIIAILGVVIFVTFSVTFIHILSNTIHKLISAHQLGINRAGAVQFTLRTFGYLTIMLTTLELVGIPVGRLLLGSAVLGIILGVAAQQALANFFASFILILSHPFSVGESITIGSGALGGKYSGTVADIGLTHTQLQEENGNIILIPNATLLSNATIMARKNHHKSEENKE
jgi:small-conductance mechanosensitive channel